MSGTPAIIAVAITGSIPRKSATPAVPVTPAEQIESAYEAFQAGASLVHIHVRAPDETPSSDPDLFRQVQDGIRRHCPGMIVQFSTSGRAQENANRLASLPLRPDMASLATGSVNFKNFIYENSPQLVDALTRTMLDNDVKPEIEVFDAAMLYTATALANKGLLRRPLHVQFVLGVENALPMRRELLEFLLKELKTFEPDATWSVVGIGRDQLVANRWCLELGGHVRTGLEDNIRFDETRLARSNAELVSRLADLCREFGRPPATPAQARELLHLRAA